MRVRFFASVILILFSSLAHAACLDSILLVHGNGMSPTSWNPTVELFVDKGYERAQMFLPEWGSSCLSCNDHSEKNLQPVQHALRAALQASCTGKVSVIAHSMGVTLAMQAIQHEDVAPRVRVFVGIAGAQHGLNACGMYPFEVPVPTCGRLGLSVGSPLVLSLQNRRYGEKMYSIKSNFDEVICGGFAGCLVGGNHTSNIDGQDEGVTFDQFGHLELQSGTAEAQYRLVHSL